VARSQPKPQPRPHLRLRLSARRLALLEAAAANGFTFASLDHLLYPLKVGRNLIDRVAVVSQLHKRKGVEEMADGRAGGIGLGGILVIVGIVLAILLGHWWVGVIVALVGLVFFGGFAKGKWY
jgi:hypothetical protein